MICGFRNAEDIIYIDKIGEEDIAPLGEYIIDNLEHYTFEKGFDYEEWEERWQKGWLENYYKVSDGGNIIGYFSFNSLKYKIVYASLYFTNPYKVNMLYKASVSFTKLHSNIKTIKFGTKTPYSISYSINRLGAIIIDNEDGVYDMAISLDDIKDGNLYGEIIYEC